MNRHQILRRSARPQSCFSRKRDEKLEGNFILEVLRPSGEGKESKRVSTDALIISEWIII